MRHPLLIALIAGGLVFAAAPATWAQSFDDGDEEHFDPRPPPPPPPSDRDFGPGYLRPFGRPPGFREGPRVYGARLLCRTPEGACRPRRSVDVGEPCRCDFGDGPVRGRIRP